MNCQEAVLARERVADSRVCVFAGVVCARVCAHVLTFELNRCRSATVEWMNEKLRMASERASERGRNRVVASGQ